MGLWPMGLLSNPDFRNQSSWARGPCYELLRPRIRPIRRGMIEDRFAETAIALRVARAAVRFGHALGVELRPAEAHAEDYARNAGMIFCRAVPDGADETAQRAGGHDLADLSREIGVAGEALGDRRGLRTRNEPCEPKLCGLVLHVEQKRQHLKWEIVRIGIGVPGLFVPQMRQVS